MGTLVGRVALVTGGARGIGEAIARRLAAEGAAVTITYGSSAEPARLVAKEIGGVAVAADGADRAAVRAAVNDTATRHGRLDILVNNAAVPAFGPIGQISDEAFDQAIAVNLTAVHTASREALRHLGEGGRIITIGSVNADRVPFPGGTAYALTKAGVAGFTRALAREVSARGITVNNVQPGPIDTAMNPADGPLSAVLLPHIATGHYGTADEVAALVGFLAGPEAGYITGASINIDGGFTA
ncbi:3-ketoacyl-ACP reductase [Actinoplanes lobatus]|uniref:3-ketoacyl-ACP reductase n=1 Tax=Actinoplanes lobatus TaxID=113568 RepID=A0A7W7MJF8_9ACTN|nr:SDR family oxidoreductase [Actinoplanes lobatus]MBB4752025.1 3-oxoacyl-[acyl-carrier protein] reductase [Actinoplanes lobatus]GGN85036.1 3-ketoacyl-ACP reductase [Actinoplanes lobatus]GIE45354.1 3-ketoacyl-ACP reductase [Actinoplanes lobatus]